MSYLKIVDSILIQIKETQDPYSLISIDSIHYDRGHNSLFISFRYQLISKGRNIYYTIFIENINNKNEIINKINYLINEITVKNKIRLKI